MLPSLAGGGAERAAVHIVNSLDAAAWDRSMYLFKREGPYLPDLAPRRRASRRDARLAPRPVARAQTFSSRAERPELVVSFLSYFTVLTAVSRGWQRIARRLQSADADVGVSDRRRLPLAPAVEEAAFSAVTRLGYAAADLIVATSRGVSEDLVESFGVAREKIRVVHNPVDISAIRGAAIEPLASEHAAEWQSPVIVAAGRLADAKNYPLMLDALALLRQRVPARLFILGRGEREAAIRERIAARGLERAVVLCGFQPNPWKFIARADVFLLTSRYEGFGNVLIEAMACGVPVVATASPGTRDIVTDEGDGLLVDAHTPEAVAAALERVLVDRDLRARMSEHARRSAERFALDVVGREYDMVLREALA